MSTYKTTSSDYIVSVGPYTGNAWHGTMTVNGNLNVVGNITYVADIAVNDAFIVVAANNTGTVTSMGLVATRDVTANAYAGLRFNTTVNAWQISSNVTFNGVGTYSNLVTTSSASTPGGPANAVQFNGSGSFAGSGNLIFDEATSNTIATFTLKGTEVFLNTGNVPTYSDSSANGVALYNNVIGQGGTGLYIKNLDVDQELVSKSKAIIFSLIF